MSGCSAADFFLLLALQFLVSPGVRIENSIAADGENQRALTGQDKPRKISRCVWSCWRRSSALSIQHGSSNSHPYRGVALGSPADLDPMHSFDAARPEWAFRGLYQFSHYFPGEKAVIAIFVVPGAILLLLSSRCRWHRTSAVPSIISIASSRRRFMIHAGRIVVPCPIRKMRQRSAPSTGARR